MIKDQEYAGQVFEMIDTAIEASEQMKTCLEYNNNEEYLEIKNGLAMFLQYIRSAALDLQAEVNQFQFLKVIDSVIISLENLGNLFDQNKNINYKINKIEFEIIPLLEEMRVNFYYWGMVYPDPEKIERFKEEECIPFCRNKYCEEAEKRGYYKYEVSIVVLAYNKLEYTKLCMEYLLKNIPSDLSYELILINHGSTDGTKEYFEQIKPEKQLDIAYNGGGMGAYSRIAEGKFIMLISNDVLVMRNSINNMLRCIKSDDSIAWVVPSTSNVSNYQMINLSYNSFEELEKVSNENNISDSKRWEQRVRLCNPIDIKRTVVIRREIMKEMWGGCSTLAFPDDRLSLILRRKGYKMYLAKDAYCHHFGSVTIKDEVKKENEIKYYTEKRMEFFDVFGVDPWGKGMCYSKELCEIVEMKKEKQDISVLGVECGLGSNPLKIKDLYRENDGQYNVIIKNVSSDKSVLEDLKGVSDEVEYTENIIEWVEKDENIYDHIIIECDYIKSVESLTMKMMKKLDAQGELHIACADERALSTLKREYQKSQSIKEKSTGKCWITIYK